MSRVTSNVVREAIEMKARSFYRNHSMAKSVSLASPFSDAPFVSKVMGEADEIGPGAVMSSIIGMIDRGVGISELIIGMGKDRILLRRLEEGVSDDERGALDDLRGEIMAMIFMNVPFDSDVKNLVNISHMLQDVGLSDEDRAQNAALSLISDAFRMSNDGGPGRPEFRTFGFHPGAHSDSESEVNEMNDGSIPGCGCGCQDAGDDYTAAVQGLLNDILNGNLDPKDQAIFDLMPKVDAMVEILKGAEICDFSSSIAIKLPGSEKTIRFSVELS